MTGPVVTSEPSVQFAKVAPAGVVILAAAALVSVECEMPITISCGSNGHPPTDPHTTGEAYDFEVIYWSLATLKTVVAAFDRAWQTLGVSGRFTVLYERPTMPVDGFAGVPGLYINPEATGPHLHIQRTIHTVYP